MAATLAIACGRGAPLLPAACRVHAEFERMAAQRLWPGFQPADLPLAVFDGDATWVFEFPRALAGFAADARCAGAQRAPGRHANMRANSTVDWDGVVVATVLLGALPADSAAIHAATAVHEAFHAHQRERHPRWIADEATLFTYPADDDTLLALAKLEMEALRRGIAAGDATESARWAATALAQRQRRGARMPPEAMAYERASELNEGLAQYVERRALEGGLGLTRGSRARLDDDRPADGVRWRCYASGEAWALALDRHAPGWRERIALEDSLALDVLLATAPRVRAAAPAAFEPAAVARAESAARQAVASLREARVQQGREFLSRRGHTLVFESPVDPWWPRDFDPLNVRVLNDGVVLHGRWLRVGNDADGIEILDRAVLSEPAGGHPLFTGVRRLVITGLAAPPTVTASDSTLEVRADGVTATLQHAVAATEGRATVVRSGH
jgi:hypothetical protein